MTKSESVCDGRMPLDRLTSLTFHLLTGVALAKTVTTFFTLSLAGRELAERSKGAPSQ